MSEVSLWVERQTSGLIPEEVGGESVARVSPRWREGSLYRGISLTRKRNPEGPYRRPMPRVLGGS